MVSEDAPEGATPDDQSVARKTAAAASELAGAVVTRAARDSTGRCGNVLATRFASVTWQEHLPDSSVFTDFIAAQAYQEEQTLAGNLMGFQSIGHGHLE